MIAYFYLQEVQAGGMQLRILEAGGGPAARMEVYRMEVSASSACWRSVSAPFPTPGAVSSWRAGSGTRSSPRGIKIES